MPDRHPGAPVGLAEAFDRHAATYDDVFSRHPYAVESRRRAWELCDRLFVPPARVVDLGCGTGEDALHLASRGVRVTAVDISPEMLDRLRRKAAREGVEDLVDCRVADYTTLVPDAVPQVDGVVSNFGALNCAPGLGWLGGLARGLLKPGAVLVLVPMSRFYPLETAVHLGRGRIGDATRRWRSRTTATVEGVKVPVRYYGLGDLRRALGPRFVLDHAEALHLLSPVPGLDPFGRGGGDGFRRLRGVDRWLGRKPLFRGWGDHFISVWRYAGGKE